MKKALVIVSFGSSGGTSGIDVLVSLAARRWPEYAVRQAFTSAVIRRRLAARNVPVFSLAQVLEQLCREEFEEIRICPALLSYGREYETIARETGDFFSRIPMLVLGLPLLAAQENRKALADILAERFPARAEGHGFLLVGHGAHPEANLPYMQLVQVLRSCGRSDVYPALLIGQPDVPEAIRMMKRDRLREVTILPLFLTAGKHAVEDLAGEGADSCKNQLERAGLRAACCLKGLCDYPEVLQLYLSQSEGGFPPEPEEECL